MIIWLDADACPRPIKDIVMKAAERNKVQAVLVANQPLHIPHSPFISFQLVAAGLDVADNHIVQNLSQNDIVITADVPLASNVVDKGAVAINPRGTLYTEANVKESLSVRDFMQELRDTGLVQGGPPPFNNKDKQAFAATFDKYLTKALREQK